jgi:hypothetical protein
MFSRLGSVSYSVPADVETFHINDVRLALSFSGGGTKNSSNLTTRGDLMIPIDAYFRE